MILQTVTVNVNDQQITGRIVSTKFNAKTRQFVTTIKTNSGETYEVSQQI